MGTISFNSQKALEAALGTACRKHCTKVEITRIIVYIHVFKSILITPHLWRILPTADATRRYVVQNYIKNPELEASRDKKLYVKAEPSNTRNQRKRPTGFIIPPFFSAESRVSYCPKFPPFIISSNNFFPSFSFGSHNNQGQSVIDHH